MYYGFWFDDAIQPVNILDADKNLDTIVVNQLGFQALFALGLFDIVDIGFGFPFIPYRQISDETAYDDLAAYAFEDLRIDLKWTILNRRQKCIGVGILTRVNIPTFYIENSFATDRGVSLEPAVVFDLGRRWWTFAMNLGYKYYTQPQESRDFDVDVADELNLNVGAVFRIGQTDQVMLDSATRTQVRRPFASPNTDYSEILLAYRHYWKQMNFTGLTAGVGMGLLSGVGDPKVRIFVGVTRDERRWGPGDVLF
jgi:hypothetical protein